MRTFVLTASASVLIHASDAACKDLGSGYVLWLSLVACREHCTKLTTCLAVVLGP